MRTYEITEQGKKMVRNGGGESADQKLLNYVWTHPMSTTEELEFVDDGWRIHNLARRGFLKAS